MSESRTTILVVDDSEAERYYVAKVLRKHGFEVLEAMTGRDALRLAEEGPALITLDVRLPDLSGFEVCRRLKAGIATRDIPVLHISASYTTAVWKAEGLEGGADGYLTHPVDPGELVATVRALLRMRYAEDRVRAAAREWTTTFDAIGDPVCLTTADGVLLRCNLAFARLLERPYAEIVGHPLSTLLPEVAAYAAGPRGAAGEVRIGDHRYYRISQSPVAGASDTGPRAWVLGDVTDRRRAEEAAQDRLREIEAVYNSAPAGLCVLDEELRFVRSNERLAIMSGRPLADHPGRTFREILPNLADAVEPRLREVLRTGRPVQAVEVSGEGGAAPSPGRIWVAAAYPIGRPDGRVAGMNVAIEDVTERRRAREQLEQAQRLEAVGRLAGGVAHETNNQMTVVLGCANFALRQHDLPEAVRSDLEQIRKAAERTAGITAQLLAFGRRQVVRPELVDIDQVIGRLEAILQRSLGEDCSLALELAGPPPILADVGQLEQVLLNLALNARDAMPSGGVLTIRTRRVEVGHGEGAMGDVEPGRYSVVTVSDTGVGMDDATLRQAFEPFFTTKAVGKGTGLGLSTVYGIVRQSGGYIEADSTPGLGTTFDLYFPATDGNGGPAHAAAVGGPVRGRVILLVEDDETVRRVITRELATSHHRVVEAADGRAALELVRTWQGPLDAVVTDLRLPEMDGLELARQLAALRPDLRVLFMSGHPDSEAFDYPELDRPFIKKPFTAKELSRFIDLALGRG